tara:strand:+ start:2511 stop:2762 length:252 start_codon:yes stop_codon:yes gene_type:complete
MENNNNQLEENNKVFFVGLMELAVILEMDLEQFPNPISSEQLVNVIQNEVIYLQTQHNSALNIINNNIYDNLNENNKRANMDE